MSLAPADIKRFLEALDASRQSVYQINREVYRISSVESTLSATDAHIINTMNYKANEAMGALGEAITWLRDASRNHGIWDPDAPEAEPEPAEEEVDGTG